MFKNKILLMLFFLILITNNLIADEKEISEKKIINNWLISLSDKTKYLENIKYLSLNGKEVFDSKIIINCYQKKVEKKEFINLKKTDLENINLYKFNQLQSFEKLHIIDICYDKNKYNKYKKIDINNYKRIVINNKYTKYLFGTDEGEIDINIILEDNKLKIDYL